jgi:cytosine permease
LYIVGTSTYGVQGGFVMPGFVMGLLQFCWLAFNAFFVSEMLCANFDIGTEGGKVLVPGPIHGIIAAVWAVLAAFVGLKGIQYLAKVATYLPLIPLVVLIILFVKTIGGVGQYDPKQLTEAKPKAAATDKKTDDKKTDAAKTDEAKTDDAKTADAKDGDKTKTEAKKDEKAKDAKADEKPKSPLDSMGVMLLMIGSIVGFFATAGAAGTDIASSNRDDKDVQLGGLTGIALATVFSAGLAVLIVAGAYGTPGMVPEASQGELNPVKLMASILDNKQMATVFAILLAISSFPPACFSAFIAANSFKTTMPNVNPFTSVGIGTAVAIVLAVTGWAGNAVDVFLLIGASFGPVCGAMVADYLLSGRKWAGPRAGMNPAGWISWAVGFVVGGFGLIAKYIPALGELGIEVPVAPVAAFVVGFVLYIVLAKAGLQSKTLEMPAAAK